MSNRFHSKYHRSNHHTLSSANNLDSSHDPIASPDYPFKGSMVIDSSTDDLSLSALGNVTVQGNVSATAFYGDGTNLTGVVATPASENLSADNIYSYTNFVSSIKFHNNLDMNGWSISGIADESISFESGVKISALSNLFKVEDANSVILGKTNTIGSIGYSTIAGGINNTISTGGTYVTIGGGNGNTSTAGRGNTIIGGESNTANSPGVGYVTVLGGTTNTATGAYSTSVGGASNTVGGTASLVGGNLNTVNGDFSTGFGYGVSIQSDASYAAIVGGQANSIADGTHSFVGAGNTNALSGDCGTIGAGCYNTISADNCAIVGGLSNYITGGTTNFIGAGSRNYISDGTGSFIGAGSDNNIKESALASVIVGGSTNTLSGDYASIVGGYQNIIKNTGGTNYSTIVGGQTNIIDNATNAAVLGGQTNIARGNNSIVGGTGAVTDGQYAISLGVLTSAHHDNSVVIGGTTAGTTVSEDTNTIKLSGTNGITLGNGVTCDGDLDMQGFSIKRIGNNSLEFESGLRIGSDSSTSEFQVTSASNYKLGESNVVTGNLSFVGGNNNTVDGDDSTGFGVSNTIYATASSATVFGSGNQIDDGADSSILGGTNNSLSGDCLTICAGCFNTLSSQNSFIGGGTNNSITHGTVNMIGSGNQNIIDNCSGVTIVNGQDNTIGPMEDGQVIYSAIVAGGENSLSGNASFIGAGYGNTIQKSSAGYNYSSIVGGRNNTIGPESSYSSIGGGQDNTVNGDYSIIVGGVSNRIDGDYSIAGGSGCVADGDFSVALGVAVSAHHDSSVVIGGYSGGGTVVSDDARTVKLSGLNGVTLGENLTVVGNVSATKFVGDGSELTGISGGGGGISAVVDDTSPQLGGNLDLNSNDITGTGNIDVTGDFTLEDTATDSAAGPEITLYRNSATPADGDYLGQIKFQGENDAGQTVLYSKITGKTSDVTDTTEDGLIEYAVRKAGSNTIVSRLTHEALKLINGTGLEVNGNITTDGTVDGRDVAADGATLDSLNAQVDYGTITVNLDNGTSAITTGVSAWAEMPFNGVIERVTILADQVGALSGEIQKDSYGNWPPTAADSILSFGGTNINKYEDNSPPGGTSLNLSAGDVMQFVVLSADTITKAVVSLKVRKEL